MKKYILLLAIIFSLKSYSACEDISSDVPRFEWKNLTELTVTTLIGNIEANLCLGFSGEEVQMISYRDDSGNNEMFPVTDLLVGPLTLLTDEDISAGGILRKGKIMTLVMEEVVALNHYKLSLNFLRNLAKMPTKRDHRRLTVEVKKDETGEYKSYYKTEDKTFNQVEINITAGLNINEAQLFEYGSFIQKIETSGLPKIKDL
jgi:hypothetical protein